MLQVRALFLGLLAMLLAIGPAQADIGVHSAREDSNAPDAPRKAPLRLRLVEGGAFQPKTILAVQDGAVFEVRTPDRFDVVGEDRFDLSGLPLIGELFGGQPASAAARDANHVGDLERAGDVLILRLGPKAAKLPSQIKLAAVSNGRRISILELEALAPLNPRDGPAPARAQIVGGVFAQGDRLVLSPPREILYGFRLY